MATTNLQLPQMLTTDAQKELTFNDAMGLMDAFVPGAAISYTTTAPPTSPTNGSMYIIPTGATGVWANNLQKIAIYYNGWSYITPQSGWSVFVQDVSKIMFYSSSTSVWSNYISDAEVNYGKIVSLIGKSVLSITVISPPTSPNDMDTYIIPSSGSTGDWSSYPNYFATYSSGSWVYTSATSGMSAYIISESARYSYNGSSWEKESTSEGVSQDIVLTSLMSGVISRTTSSPPSSPSVGDAYIAPTSMSGDWASFSSGSIIYYSAEDTWLTLTPKNNWRVYVSDDDAYYTYSSSSWNKETSNISFAFSIPGTPTASEVIGQITCPVDVNFAANFVGSLGTVGVAPSATYQIEIQDGSGTTIGTISIDTSSNVTFSGSAITISAGKAIRLVAQSTVDSDISIISITLLGVK